MNTTIDALIADCTHTVTDYSVGIDSSVEVFDKEAFSRALVKLCVDKLSSVYAVAESGPYPNDHENGWNCGMLNAIETIKKVLE